MNYSLYLEQLVTKYVNGHNVSKSIYLQVQSHKDLTDCVEPITLKKLKLIVMHTRKPIHRPI